MRFKPRNKMTYVWVLAVLFTVWFSIKLNQSLNRTDERSRVEYQNYEAYVLKHNCDRRIESDKVGSVDMRPYFYCDNGVWAESDLVDVANSRVPRAQ